MGRRAGNEGVGTGRAALVASLGFHLGQAHRAVREIWEERLADLGLSGPQAVVLRAVGRAPLAGSGSWPGGPVRTSPTPSVWLTIWKAPAWSVRRPTRTTASAGPSC